MLRKSFDTFAEIIVLKSILLTFTGSDVSAAASPVESKVSDK